MISGSSALERETLQAIGDRFTSRGYRFVAGPNDAELPPFLRGVRPDAVAFGDAQNILIEVLSNSGPKKSALNKEKAASLLKLLEGHRDWSLEVVYTRTATATPPAPNSGQIKERIEEVRRLAPIEPAGALLLAWSILEAAARALEPEQGARGLSPSALIELLLSLGYVSQEVGNDLRRLGVLRNSIAHGDLSLPGPDALEIEKLLTVASVLAERSRQR